MTTPLTLEDIARKAIDGDREALEILVRALQGGHRSCPGASRR